MEYLQASLELKKLIKEKNELILSRKTIPGKFNFMFVNKSDGELVELDMASYTNEFVLQTLSEFPESKSFVITDVATMDVKGKQLTYWLYKAYHFEVEKGLVYYQLVDKDTFEPVGELQFSNLEDNIFYKVSAPEFEESSNNAMEADVEIPGKKSIVFLIGNMDESRLLFDIQRLIFETVNNVQRHTTLDFHFIVNVSKFNGTPSPDFLKKVKAIEDFTKEYVTPEYPNAEFVFDIEK